MKKIIIITVIVITALFSCKKDDAPKPSCRIITMTPVPAGMNSTSNFTYNSDGKLSIVTSGDETVVYVYSGSTIIANSTSSGIFNYKKNITLNSFGLITNIRTEQDEAGTLWDNYAIEYNGTEAIKSTYTTSSGGAPTIEMYKWIDGNLVTIINGSVTFKLEYYTNLISQPGDYFNYTKLTNGYVILKNKNALKAISDGSDITNLDYNFDSDGKIISMIITGAFMITYNYQYHCN